MSRRTMFSLLWVDELEGDPAPQPDVAGTVDVPHAAAADEPLDLEVIDERARGQRLDIGGLHRGFDRPYHRVAPLLPGGFGKGTPAAARRAAPRELEVLRPRLE